MTTEINPGDWPRGVADPFCPSGHRLDVDTSTDHRLLWHIEGELSVLGGTERLRQLTSRLREYLNATCQHHWHEYEAEDDMPAHRQCLWCNAVEWVEEATA